MPRRTELCFSAYEGDRVSTVSPAGFETPEVDASTHARVLLQRLSIWAGGVKSTRAFLVAFDDNDAPPEESQWRRRRGQEAQKPREKMPRRKITAARWRRSVRGH